MMILSKSLLTLFLRKKVTFQNSLKGSPTNNHSNCCRKFNKRINTPYTKNLSKPVRDIF